MENKIWKMGEYNKDTNLYFWSYQDRFHTKELWVTLEKFKEKKRKSLEYNRSKKYYYKSRYEKNKEVILSNSRKKYFERKDYKPLYYLWKNAVNRHISRKSNSHIKCELTYDDVVQIYDNQNGKCYYTGLEMVLLGAKSPYKISIDRIDSNKNYSVDNCVLCCQCINYAKNMYSVEEFRLFLKNTYNSKDFISFINE